MNKSLDSEQFLSRLDELDFFEGFPTQAKSEYQSFIKDRLDEQLDGPNSEYYQCYPGLSLVVVELGMIIDTVETDIEELAEASFGLFDPYEIQVVGEDQCPTLEFDLDGETHRFTEDISTFVFRCFDFVASRFGRQANLVRPHAILYPLVVPAYFVVLCTPKALARLEKANLIPLEYEEIESKSFMDWVPD